MRICEIVDNVGGECIGDDSLEITGIETATKARSGDVTFAENRRFLADAEASNATAVVVPPDVRKSSKVLLRADNVMLYVADLVDLFFPEERPRAEIHPSAVIASSAQLGQRVSVGANAVIEEHCRIGDDCLIGPGVWFGPNCTLGDRTHIHANVSIYPFTRIGKHVIIHSGTVIGADGFSYAPSPRGIRKLRQIGIVQIDDDVEIGANSCIDRASFGVTRIQAGVKIDNLVQIAHNVEVGAGSIVVAQCGLAGSVKLGRNVFLGGQVGVSHHHTLGDGVQVGGGSKVFDNIPAGERWMGYLARPGRQFVEEQKILPKLVKMRGALRQLDAQPTKSGQAVPS